MNIEMELQLIITERKRINPNGETHRSVTVFSRSIIHTMSSQ